MGDGALSGKRGAKKWDSFEHHGVCFAAPYEKHGIPITYDGKPIQLNLEAEEVATYWVACRGSEYEKKDIFINNFWPAFTSRLSEELQPIIKEFSKCNFDAIWDHREKTRQERLGRSREEKKKDAKDENAKKDKKEKKAKEEAGGDAVK